MAHDAPTPDASLLERIERRESGICLYGLAPPKQADTAERIAEIAAKQTARINGLRPDGVVVYDIQDETSRTSEARPFPFLPTVDPHDYATRSLGEIAAPKVVYRSVGGDSEDQFRSWVERLAAHPSPAAAVFVGAPSKGAPVRLGLSRAYDVAREVAPTLPFGGIAIAERHGRRLDEHERIAAKVRAGCRFFVTQAVYDVTATKSLLSDLALWSAEHGVPVPPIILTFSPCASPKTLAFMQWLGISFPRWLENELRHAADPLATSVELCLSIFEEAWAFGRAKGIPMGVNVESVSIRRREIDASVALFEALRSLIHKS